MPPLSVRRRSGELPLRQLVLVHVVRTGTLGTRDLPGPSVTGANQKPSQREGVDEVSRPTEKNEFSIIDGTADTLMFTMFLWRPLQSIDEIETMVPALVC
jgi:hypothetical protein